MPTRVYNFEKKMPTFALGIQKSSNKTIGKIPLQVFLKVS